MLSVWGVKPLVHVYSQVLGLSWCLVWPDCTDVYHEVYKI